MAAAAGTGFDPIRVIAAGCCSAALCHSTPAESALEVGADALRVSPTLTLSAGGSAGGAASAPQSEEARIALALVAASGISRETQFDAMEISSVRLRPDGGVGLRVAGIGPERAFLGSESEGVLEDRRDPSRRDERPETWLLAQAPAPAPEGRLSPAQRAAARARASSGDESGGDPDPTSPAARAAARARQESELSQFRFGLGPLRWGGTLSDSLSLGRTSSEGGSTQSQSNSVSLALNAASFIWQPWFLRFGVNGALYFARSQTDSGPVAGESIGSTQSRGVTGGLDLALLPASRFPFSASFAVTDDLATGSGLVGDPVRTVRTSLRQSYQPQLSRSNYQGGLTHSVASRAAGTSTVTSVTGNASFVPGKAQSLSVSAAYSASTETFDQTSIKLGTLTATHSYAPSSNFSLISDANVSTTSQDFGVVAGSSQQSFSSAIAQLGSSVNWRPGDDSPWNFSGTGRYFLLSSGIGNEQFLFHTFLVSGSASYRYSNNLSMSGGVGLSYSLTDTGNTGTLSGTLGAIYVGDPIQLAGGNYQWGVSGSTGAQGSTGDTRSDTQTTVTTSANHSWSKGYALSRTSTLNFGVGQGVAATMSSAFGTSESLTHSGSVSWGLTTGRDSRIVLRATGTDSRNFGATTAGSTSLDLGANGYIQISRHSSAEAALTVTGTRFDQTGMAWSVSGTVDYAHNRPFGIRGMRYTLRYLANTQLLGGRDVGNPDAPVNPATHSLDQKLEYTIGRLIFRAGLLFNRFQTSNSFTLNMTVSRSFGAF